MEHRDTVEEPERFCAIDFETACYQRASACAVGLARIRGGEIGETCSFLIRPPRGMEIIPRFTAIHGISNEMVRDKPGFEELWPEIADFIGGDTLVAHNAPFDRSVLRGALDYWGIRAAVPPFECTLQLSRRRWPHLPRHRLDAVCSYLGIELNHHDALSDAVACGRIWILGT